MNSISNNNNMSGILYLNSLINTISDCKQLCFSSSNINSIMNCFGINIAARVDIKTIGSGLCFFLFSFFYLFFTFSIFRTLGLGLEVISHISHL